MTKSLSPPIPARFYSLDVLRGLAAFCVILHHWRFLIVDIVPHTVCKWEQMPLNFFLSSLYEDGDRGLSVFFSLSGFIFFWLYSDRIAKSNMTFKEFFLLRFSRLYPLHLVTLLFMFFAQNAIHYLQGEFFVYQSNDVYHLILNLLYASSWGFEKTMSLNGPAWSTSVEMLLYGCFFVICTVKMTRWWQIIPIILAGYIMMILRIPKTGMVGGIGHGVLMFFLGGISFQIYRKLKNNPTLKQCHEILMLGLIFLWTSVWLALPSSFINTACVHFESVVPFLIYDLFFKVFIIQFTIISLALLETFRGTLGKRFSILGDISYSCYLIHFPLQIIIAGIVVCFNSSINPIDSPYNAIDRSIFYSPWMLLGFFAILLSISYLSYRYFEKPVQEFLRARLLKKREPQGKRPLLAEQGNYVCSGDPLGTADDPRS